jgi:DNA-binding NtrC family response regulator
MQPSDAAILYLEDEIIVALDTSQTLTELGFSTVHLCHNLRRAQALSEKLSAGDFALLDVNIAGEGLSIELGRDLLARGVHVVFASGYNRHEMEAEHAGLPFVEKPLTAETIRDAFARLEAAAD